MDGAANPGSRVASSLTTRCIVAAKDGTVGMVFDHRYSFQSTSALNQDGGQVQMSVNLGPFLPLPATSFEAHGYQGVVTGNNVLQNQEAFTAQSPGHGFGEVVRSIAVLGRFRAGDVIRIRFVSAWDGSIRGAVPNWEIQNVAILPWGASLQSLLEP